VVHLGDGQAKLAAAVGAVAAEVERRSAEPDMEHPPIYLAVFDLGRFKSLKKPEDEFSFGRKDENKPVEPGKLFGTILRDGPALGVHVIAWCDTYANLSRALDRQAVREFDGKVLFQMSGNDSSQIIDSPAASKLGLHRALFCSEEQGRMEKFRPYGIPDAAWLASAKERLARR